MPCRTTVILGPTRCGKTRQLLTRYREALRARSGVGRVLWLAPTARTAAAVRQDLVAASEAQDSLDTCLDPGVTTFARLAEGILAPSLDSPRVISQLGERELVRRILRATEERDALGPLASAARRASFADLVIEHIHELKRRGIRPAEFAKAAPSRRDDREQHTVLADLYDGYDRLLDTNRLADVETQQWAACRVLAGDEPTPLDHLSLVVADGFTDFTVAQHEMLQHLASRSKRLLISLPGEEQRTSSKTPGVGRGDLFAKSTATLAELRRRHPKLSVEHFAARTTGWAAMDYLGRNIFRHPRDVEPPSADASFAAIEIVPTAGPQQEIVQLARIIKRRLVVDGARPEDMVVVFRQLHSAAPRVREVFAEFGIPFAMEAAVPIAATGLFRTLLALLRLDAADWPFRGVVSVVTNNMLTSIDRRDRVATERLVRDLQIAADRRALLSRVEHLAARENEQVADQGTTHPGATGSASAAEVALAVLDQLATLLDELPTAATPTDWLSALQQLTATLGLAANLQSRDVPDDSTLAHEHAVAWQLITQHFAAVERLAGWLGEAAPALSRAELITLLIDVGRELLPRPADDVGRVRVLSAATARTVAAKHILLAGMSELAFPSPERPGRLYSDADYRVFESRAFGRPRQNELNAASRSQEEMLLFYEVLTRATERLTISYPALDEKAQSLPPSPYVSELQRLIGPERLAARRLPRPSPLPADATPSGPADWRVLAVEQALRGDDALLAGLFAEPSLEHLPASLDAALRIIAARSDRDRFGPAEGLLASDDVERRLQRRFGPQHLWSPSQWERYARCPFHYFMEDVLGLEPLGELVLDTDHRRRGSRLHHVLAEFHRRLAAAAASGEAEVEVLQAEFARALDEVMNLGPRVGVDAALAEIDRRQIDRWGRGYFDQFAKYNNQWAKLTALDSLPTPKHFELRFGPPHAGSSEEPEGDDPHSTSLPFVLDIGDEQIRISGRIDRIDVGQGKNGRLVFNVIDYKSGRRPTLSARHIETGQRLQPPLYVMAAQAVLFGEDEATPLWAGYWSMDKGVTTDARYSLHCSDDGTGPSDDWIALRAKVIQRVAQFVADIRRGNYPVASRDDQCTSHCPFATVCRITQVRSLNKTWWPEVEAEETEAET